MTASSSPPNNGAAVDTGVPASTHPCKAESVTDELLADGSMMLFHTGRQELLTLNSTAALVWECCDGAHDFAAIVAEVQEVFPDVSSVPDDVRAALIELRTHGMLADDAT